MNKYLFVLRQIATSEKTLQSDFVRGNARLIAEAASRGHISSLNINTQIFDNRWFITLAGTKFLMEYIQ